MAFLTPLEVRLLNDRAVMPWMTLSPLEYESQLTGETYSVPRYFRTDGASLPAALVALPVVGSALFLRYFGRGVFQGFKAGVLHDYLRRQQTIWDEGGNMTGLEPPLVSAAVAHRVFREALQSENYPDDIVNTYYAAVVAFNS